MRSKGAKHLDFVGYIVKLNNLGASPMRFELTAGLQGICLGIVHYKPVLSNRVYPPYHESMQVII